MNVKWHVVHDKCHWIWCHDMIDPMSTVTWHGHDIDISAAFYALTLRIDNVNVYQNILHLVVNAMHLSQSLIVFIDLRVWYDFRCWNEYSLLKNILGRDITSYPFTSFFFIFQQTITINLHPRRHYYVCSGWLAMHNTNWTK